MNVNRQETDQSLIETDMKNLQLIAERSPQAIIRTAPINPKEAYPYIGIHGLQDTPKGFLRFSPQDFIVEEIGIDNEISSIAPTQDIPTTTNSDKTIYADMVKIGMSTLDAVKQVSETLNIAPGLIGYSGIKDARAITSQGISIRGASIPKIQQASWNQIFLKNLISGKGALAPGQLQGNKFTLFVRTQEPYLQHILDEKLSALSTHGYPNFYGIQRFGNRLLNPILGKLLAQGAFEEATKVFLTASGPFDIQIYTAIRKKAVEHYGNWKTMRAQFDLLPYRFRHERKLLSALIQYNSNYSRAFLSIEDQVKFWIYGYASYIINSTLSGAYTGTQDIPNPLPMPLGGGFSDELYSEVLRIDETVNYAEHLSRLPFWRKKYRTLDPWIAPTIHQAISTPEGVALSFSLPRAAYATTMLMFLFEIYEGTPVPEWVAQSEVDSKELVHETPVRETVSKFIYQDFNKQAVQEEIE
ncbi:MAG: tRNA pseudouridine(13) synthase TruD [Candidatus Andersenbacteria bacterium]